MPPDDPCSYNSRMRGASNSVVSREKARPGGPHRKLFERSHRIAVQELVIEQIRTELERYFMDFLRFAAIRKPGMGRIAAHQHQFHIPDRPHMVADYARSSRGIDYQIEFHLLVRVEGEVEAALLPRKIMKQSLSVSGVLSRSISICRTFKRVPVTKLNNSHNSQKNTKFTNTYILYIKPVMNS